MTHFNVYVYLAGDTRMLLCTVESAQAVGAVLEALCRPERPAYQKIEVELCRTSL